MLKEVAQMGQHVIHLNVVLISHKISLIRSISAIGRCQSGQRG